MPFDNRTDLPVVDQSYLARPRYRAVALWLFGLCGMILVMVSLGGATRLTGSGLSIMEWAPIMGTLPPLSDGEWKRLYTLYQQIPQYTLVNQGFGIEGFKHIFWLEWAHRLWGRLMGFAFLLPMLWFAARSALPRGLLKRLVLLLALGGLQGGVGWLMVASGFEADSTAVSPYRLVVHLTLALSLYVALLWTALGVWQIGRVRTVSVSPGWLRPVSAGMVGMVAVTIVAGGFVAGLKAGLTYNTFPLMDGRLVPEGYAGLQPFLRNLTENVAAVQFDHRLLATLTATFIAVASVLALRARPAAVVRRAVAAALALVGLQYALGVATLLYVVPVSLGTAHQALAVLLLTAVLVVRHTQRRVSI
jgi:cytochrome c oxidase assembly protein subunit 15